MANEDLLKDTSEIKENGNYFLLTINDLDINTSYPLQFRWNYKDKTYGDWSAARVITTPGESTPSTPRLLESDVTTETPGAITVNWTGKNASGADLTNIVRVDVYIEGSPFDAAKPTVSLTTPVKQLIFAPAGTYIVSLIAISAWGTSSAISNPVTVTVSGVQTPVTSPETPSAPVIKSGLASIIVEWDGKKSGGTDLATTGFAGAKVYVGTTSNFVPSDNNWVHTLNFANGANRVSIGVGSVIDKSSGDTLQYGTTYYVKLKTVNSLGVEGSTAVASSPTSISVSKLPASEISTGIISADASITAGISGGARAVMSGGSSPFVIYGTDGTTKLLEFIGGSTGTLAINGSGTFTGNLSIGSGDTIFKADPSVGIWLGDADYADADFRVSTNGILRARSGTIGGWDIGSTYLQNSAQTFQINSTNSTLYVGPYTTGDHIRISASGGIQHTNSSGSATGKFTLTPNGNLTLAGTFTIDSSSTIAGTSATTVTSGAATGSTAVQPGNGVSLNASKQITTITPSAGLTISTATSGSRVEINNLGIKAYSGTTNTVSINSDGTASFTGTITGSSFTSTNYAAGNGIGILSSSSRDQIQLFRDSALTFQISSIVGGSVINGPSSSAIAFTNTGAITIGNTNNGLLVSSVANGGFILQNDYSPNTSQLRNIESSTTAPTLTTGAASASGNKNGDIYLVRAS